MFMFLSVVKGKTVCWRTNSWSIKSWIGQLLVD